MSRGGTGSITTSGDLDPDLLDVSARVGNCAISVVGETWSPHEIQNLRLGNSIVVCRNVRSFDSLAVATILNKKRDGLLPSFLVFFSEDIF